MDDRSMSSDPGDPGDLELAQRLEAYADARLSPSVAATTSMRMGVMAEAHRQAALQQADRIVGAADQTWAARARRRPPGWWGTWRRPIAAILAGSLTLAILTGTAWSARPGGPLYGARIWTEMANLPADILARAEAEASRLDRRVKEAQQAVSAGDGPGTAAAMAAYTTIVVEATRISGDDEGARRTISTSIEANVTVLTSIVEEAPSPPARAAAETALIESERAIEGLRSAPGS